MTNPKISIIIPKLNSTRYLKECIDSVLSQSLRDIEIICVDSGSTDGTLEVLQDYAKKDSRLSLIISERKSYGYQMNLGISQARGEYIGIVESDDFAKPQMFERLYSVAKEQDCDIIKSDILCFHTDNATQKAHKSQSAQNPQDSQNSAYKFTLTPIVKQRRFYGKKLIFDLRLDLRQDSDSLSDSESRSDSRLDLHLDSRPNLRVDSNPHSKFTTTKIALLKSAWKMNQSSIFRREFLQKHSIRFNETLGASYQDTGFSFISTICASSIYLLDKAYYYYRTDNESSSSNSKDKVYCICDEYDYIARFLEREKLMSVYGGLYHYLRFCGYKWNVERIAAQSKLEFLYRFQKDFAHLSASQIKSCGFKWHQRRKLAKILDSPRDFYAELLEPKPKGLWRKIKHYFKHYIIKH